MCSCRTQIPKSFRWPTSVQKLKQEPPSALIWWMKACFSEGCWPTKASRGSVGPSKIALSPAVTKSNANASQRRFAPVKRVWYSDIRHVEGTLRGLVELRSNLSEVASSSWCPRRFETISRSMDSKQRLENGPTYRMLAERKNE